MRPVLVIMIKLPRVGRVKTRLGGDIGLVQATWWFRHQTQRLLRTLGCDPRWDTVLAVAPDAEGLATPIWGNHLARMPQGGGDLGARMGRVFQNLRAGPTIIIGADIPNITPALIADGFHKLGNNHAVLGPAPDGGYWAIGLRQGAKPPPQHLFENVRWSTEHAMADTVATMPDASIAYLPELQDIDRADDLLVLRH